MTNANGTTVETTNYMPFGSQRDHTGTEVTNYKFTDQELDPETGLYNYGARLYDPVIGRFISADTIVPAPYDPQSLNRYSYVRNNPLVYVDPTGHGYDWGDFCDDVSDTWNDIEEAYHAQLFSDYLGAHELRFWPRSIRAKLEKRPGLHISIFGWFTLAFVTLVLLGDLSN